MVTSACQEVSLLGDLVELLFSGLCLVVVSAIARTLCWSVASHVEITCAASHEFTIAFIARGRGIWSFIRIFSLNSLGMICSILSAMSLSGDMPSTLTYNTSSSIFAIVFDSCSSPVAV